MVTEHALYGVPATTAPHQISTSSITEKQAKDKKESPRG
jgi:hypothetical protein